MKSQIVSSHSNTGLFAFNTWLSQIDVTPITGWRWRRNGWIKTVNISGRVYVSREAVAEFTRRAEIGEFAKEHKTPPRISER